MTPRKGDIFAGKYRLVGELGSGSQGQVWRAVHQQMGTPLAIKILDPKLAEKRDYQARFRREARAAATLRSANVVQIFDFDIWQGCPYIAMELLEGTDLGVRLELEGKLPLPEVAMIVSQVARALNKAHRLGIVHRDLKPDNIFLVNPEDEEEPVVKILDFGVAKASTSDSLSMTGTGVVLGTPYYMSPEQAQGDSSLDFRTDLWALGVITYEALLGERPFQANNLGDLLVAICNGSPPVPSEVDPTVPPGFDEWFLQACAHDPNDRFSSAKEMAAALNVIAGRSPGSMLDSSLHDIRLPSEASIALKIHDTRQKENKQEEAAIEVDADLGAPEDNVIPPTVRDPSPPVSENDPTQVMDSLPVDIEDWKQDLSSSADGEQPGEPSEAENLAIATAETLRDQSADLLERSSDGERVEVFRKEEVQRELELARAELQGKARGSAASSVATWKKVLYPVGGGVLMGLVIILLFAIFGR